MTTAPRAAATSDLAGFRRIVIGAAVAAAVVVVAALAAPRGQMASPGPLARPHVVARIACTSCHGQDGRSDAARSCGGCHGAHASTRAGHANIGCATCHPAHASADGVTFASSGSAIRWIADAERDVASSGPAGATVPLVRAQACERCHDARRSSDPIRACISRGSPFDLCFDEHQTPDAPLGSRGVCSRQHGAARVVAWEAARAVALQQEESAPRAAASIAPHTSWWLLGSGVFAGALAFAGVAVAQRRARRSTSPAAAAPRTVRLPVVDAGRCLGCHACVDACPFDVLSVERHVAVVARPDECCGVGSCAAACPNGSLVLADEGSPPPNRPRVGDDLESLDAPGVFVAGDVSGVPLIRNAIVQGVRAAEGAAATLRGSKRGEATGGTIDLAIVGAGPAGLAAALRAKELGLRAAVLEQSTVAATIRAFPRGKIVHDPPIDLPLEGPLWLRECTKEELVAHWTRIVRAHAIDVRERHRVVRVERSDGALLVHVDSGRAVRAARVLLAIGRRGSPRTLDATVAPEAESRVVGALSDARALAGKRVLVVGLGDSAMEATIALARQPGTTVTLSYRGAGFVRGRAHNVEQVRALAARGRVRLAFESVVERIDQRWALLRTPQGVEKLPIDLVLALIGGEPSAGLLESAGIRMHSG